MNKLPGRVDDAFFQRPLGGCVSKVFHKVSSTAKCTFRPHEQVETIQTTLNFCLEAKC